MWALRPVILSRLFGKPGVGEVDGGSLRDGFGGDVVGFVVDEDGAGWGRDEQVDSAANHDLVEGVVRGIVGGGAGEMDGDFALEIGALDFRRAPISG